MKKNILVGQSGGPTAVINASLYGVIAEGMARPEEVDHVYGMVNGIEGFLSGHVMDLSSLTHEDLILLKQTPAAYLGSCRFKLPENLDAPVSISAEMIPWTRLTSSHDAPGSAVNPSPSSECQKP